MGVLIARLERKLVGFGHYHYEVFSSGEKKEKMGQVLFESAPAGYINVSGMFPSSGFHLECGRTFGAVQWEGKVSRKEAGQFRVNNQDGIIYNCGEKGSNPFNGIYYWEFCISGLVYKAYEVGFGRKGIYNCIWRGDHLAAMVSKDMATRRFESGYTLYSPEIPVEWMALFTIYWDLTRYPPSSSRTEMHTLNTWQKELKNKYDPDFIPRLLQEPDEPDVEEPDDETMKKPN